MYVQESIAHHVIPVLTYYQLLQSRPAVGSGELQKDLSNLRNPATMRAYWADFSLLLRRVAPASAHHLVVIHVEPDLWGYLEQAHAVALGRSFAHRLIALRNRIAPHVVLAWHLSVWGTGVAPTYSKPSLREMDALAAKSAAFYESLHAHFNLVFNDVTDRDADFYKLVEGNPHTWWGPSDFARLNRYLSGFTRRTHTAVVLWQLPLGNTFLNDTWGHYRDNRVQWWLGAGSAESPARHPERRRDRAAVRRRCHGHHQRADRRRLVLPAGPPLRKPPARAALIAARCRYPPGAPRPSQNSTNWRRRGSAGPGASSRCAHARASRPRAPGR